MSTGKGFAYLLTGVACVACAPLAAAVAIEVIATAGAAVLAAGAVSGVGATAKIVTTGVVAATAAENATSAVGGGLIAKGAKEIVD